MEKSITETLDLHNMLKKITIFSMLNKNTLWPLANLARLCSFKPGEVIINDNSPPIGIFIIQKGSVQIYKTGNDGSEFGIAELMSGQIIGEMSVLDKSNTSASVRALEEVECIFISEWDFTTQMHTFPEFGTPLILMLNEYIRNRA